MMRTLLSEDAQKSNALRYGVAAASVAIVSLLTLGLGSLAQFTPFTLFLAAVAFSAWYGGLGPGLFATALSTFAATFIVFPGLVARGLDESDYAVRVFVFLLAALLIDGLSYARTRAEVRIRGERARLQVTLASIGDAVITTGTDGRITYLNPAAEALTGWNPAGAVGRPLSEVFNIINEVTRTPAENPVTQVLRNGTLAGLANHTLIVSKDGTERPIDDSAAPIRDEAGNTVGVVLVFRDVTERRQTQLDLQRSRDQLEIILQSVADGVTAQDTHGQLVYANDAALRTLGFKSFDELQALSQSQLLGRYDLLQEDGQPFPLENLPARLAFQGSRQAVGGQGILPTADRQLPTGHESLIGWRVRATGELHWSIVRATAAFDDDGRPYMAISIFRDITEQKLAEQERERLLAEVQHQRERLDNIVTSMPGVVWEAWGQPDEQSQRIDYVSKYVETMLGYTTEEWTATPNFWRTIVHPDDKDQAARVAAEHFASGESGTNRFRWLTKDGRALWVEANSSIIKDEQGRPLGMRGVTIDISDRKRLEDQVHEQAEAIKTEYERLASLIANVDIGLSMTDDRGRIIIANDKWLEQTGYRREQVMGRRHEEFSTNPGVESTQAVIDKVLKDGEPFYAREAFVQSTNRPEGWYADGSVIPLRGPRGEITGALSVSVDVTENVRARQQLEAQRAILETIVEGAPIGVALLDSDMRILNLNAEWARMTGVDLVTARGRILYDAAPSFEERRPVYERVLKGEPAHLTNVPYQADGKDFTHYRDIYMRPVRDASGAITGMLNAVVDVTDRHTLDQQKDALIALASHELKTPITAIKGYTQLGLRAASAGTDERLIRSLRIVDDKANLLTRLVNEMLDVSRIQSGTLPLERESFDLGVLVRDVTNSIELTEPEFTFALELPPAPIEVNADRQRIEQVVTNLLQNAVKYSGDSHRVEVSVTSGQWPVVTDTGGGQTLTADHWPLATVTVRDFGVGIPEDQQSQLFERFFRASNVRSAQHSGLGLGLYITNDIIARHGGKMVCESVEGKGSTFSFTLPIVVG